MTDPTRPMAAAAEQAAAALAAAEQRGAERERAAIASDLRAWAEQGGDPWMVYVADEVAAGRRPGEDDGADTARNPPRTSPG
jgi:hypothetical protein